MSVLIIAVSLAALILKFAVFALIDLNSLKGKSYIALLVLLAVQNLVEFTGFIAIIFEASFINYFVDAYMVLLYFILGTATVIACEYMTSVKAIYFIYLLPCAAVYGHVSGSTVQGYDYSGFAPVKINGEYGGALDWYFAQSGIVAMLCPFLSKHNSRAEWAIFAYGAVVFTVIFLQQMGIHATTALFLPLSTIALIWLLFIDARNERTFNIESRFYRVLKTASIIWSDKKDLPTQVKEIKVVVCKAALIKTQQNKAEAADSIGIDISTLNRHLRE